jgi:GGDEF domain-containing protein
MIKYLLLLLLTFPVFAEESCGPSNENVDKLSEIALKNASKACAEKSKHMIKDIAYGCGMGGLNTLGNIKDGIGGYLKLSLVTVPRAFYGGAYKQMANLVDGDLTPSAIASRYASYNMKYQEEAFKRAQLMKANFPILVAEIEKWIDKNVIGFPCLPLEKQSEFVCSIVSDLLLTKFGPGLLLTGAKWTVESTAALTKLLNASKKLDTLGNMSMAERLKAAAVTLERSPSSAQKELEAARKEIEALKAAAADHGKVMKKFRNSSINLKKLDDGTEIYIYVKKVEKDGVLKEVIREIPVDAKTRAIDSNSEIGKEILGDWVKEKRGKGMLVTFDYNHLGKVNQFTGRTGTGDQYLKSGADSIWKSLREGEILFKNGGDEVLAIVDITDVNEGQKFIQRIINDFDKNATIKNIFKREVKIIGQRYKDINKATSLSDIPRETADTLTKFDLELAKKDFAAFKKDKLEVLQVELSEQAKYRGSISPGATMIRSMDNFETALGRADVQVGEVKAAYKKKYGLDADVAKTKIDVSDLETGQAYGPPTAPKPIK